MKITLEELGYSTVLENYRKNQLPDSFDVGRVIAEHKERYVVRTTDAEVEGEIVGNLRFAAHNRSDFPAVGDWVAIAAYDNQKVLIHSVLPRKTMLERQAVGKHGEKQIIAANIDYAFVVQSVDRDFNVNRIERYLTICFSSGVIPILVLSKIDLIEAGELALLVRRLEERINDVPVICISNESQTGLDKLGTYFQKGKTYCLLGSSGVGKSTLLNSLSGKPLMKTGAISTATNKGRHLTSHRELHVLENGSILIDNPGMREVGIVDAGEGVAFTFDSILAIGKNCKYNDCTHTTETGCAVIEAVEKGRIDRLSYENFLKIEREKEHFESTLAEKRRKDRSFGKMMKDFKKNNYKKL